MGRHLAPAQSATRGSRWRVVGLCLGIVLIGFASFIAGFSIVKHVSPLQVLTAPFIPTPQRMFGKGNILVLAVGLDYDYTNNDMPFSKSSRTDVIKAINLDFDHKKIYVLSIPRDSEATLSSGRVAKINEAQSEGGIKETQQVVSNFLGAPGFDRYVILRINSMRQIIDAIGGVDVDVKTADCLMHGDCKGGSLDYDDTWGHLSIHLKPGVQHLNGSRAVGYGRFRHDWCSDPCRIMRQDQVVRAMIDKIKNDKINTLLHATALIDIVHRSVTTNMSEGEMFAIANYFMDIKQADIHQAQVPYLDDVLLGDEDVLVPDQIAKAKLVHTMLLAPPVPQPSPSLFTLAQIAPASLRVDVENASGIAGAARRFADALHRQGFTIGQVSSSSRSDLAITEIHEHSRVSFAGEKVRSTMPALLQNASVVTDTTSGSPASDVTILVGRDVGQASTAGPSTKP